jgi:predicted ATPase
LSSISWSKTDGVPLFVEELTKTVLESNFLTDAGDHYKLCMDASRSASAFLDRPA